ncbi:YHS domain-containing (seleno)protein [Ferruginibacter sp.]
MKQLITATLLLMGSLFANAQQAVRKAQFNIDKNAVAVNGYDVVAYFNQGKAIKGDKKFSASAEGVVYYFSNNDNKELFLKDWKKYEPQYGGWCAYAMGAKGEKVEIDPETFKIVNGKLYLFYHSWVNNTLTKWNNDETNLKTKADKNWVNIFK